MMLVQPGESNAVDQRIFEYALWQQHRIPLIRRTLLEVATNSTFGEGGRLLMDGGAHTIAIAYFRAGYTPRDFPSSAEFEAVYLMEKSTAIKCPALCVHLAGTKKIQQVLAAKGELEKFVTPAEATQLRACFAGLYPLEEDDAETLALIANVIAHPSAYVLKPQREGGGNNLWGEEMVEHLRRMTRAERAAFILMKKIEVRLMRREYIQ
jgi:glutathione synthetase